MSMVTGIAFSNMLVPWIYLLTIGVAMLTFSVPAATYENSCKGIGNRGHAISGRANCEKECDDNLFHGDYRFLFYGGCDCIIMC